MPRQAPRIRDAVPEDTADLLLLWDSASGIAHGSIREPEEAERALASLAADPDERMVLALVDDRIVGAMHVSRAPLWPLVQECAVHTSFLMVSPEHRRHGVGHALMEAAVSWAEEKDIAQITAITDGTRENNRFLARLGLATFANVRHSSTVALRKKLSSELGRVAGGGNRHLVEVLAHRRSVRRRQSAS